jgi:hypothetical protein
VRNWGNQAVLNAGSAVKDGMRAGVQLLSGDVRETRVYEHIGWRFINGEWR